MPDARCLAGDALAAALRESRARTWSLVSDLSDAQWLPAPAPGVNPLAWELAHLAWFAEFWVLRGPHARHAAGHALAHRPARYAGPDALFDSSRLPHAERWRVALPSRERLNAMLGEQLDACIAAVPRGADADDDAALYFHRLVLLHEDMHGEAFCWLRAALGLAAPAGMAAPAVPAARPIALGGGATRLGRVPSGRGFAFDNELPGRAATLAPFEIDSAPVNTGRFREFVDAGGYGDARFWPGEAGVWRARSGLDHPRDWQRASGRSWQVRWFDHWLPLAPDAAAMHLNAFEAEAFCHWAGRRLPSAAEWEYAALHAGPEFTWGASVWEWTADAFAPHPGFAPGP